MGLFPADYENSNKLGIKHLSFIKSMSNLKLTCLLEKKYLP